MRVKDPYGSKDSYPYQFLINKKECTSFNGFRDFIEYSNDLDDTYKITEE